MDELKIDFKFDTVDGTEHTKEIPKFLAFRLAQQLRNKIKGRVNKDGEMETENALQTLTSIQEDLLKRFLPEYIDTITSESADRLLEYYYEQINGRDKKKVEGE